MDYVSAAEMAKKWGLQQRQVQTLLAGGRIPGAIKFGRSWMLPKDTEKPADLRRRKNRLTETIQPATENHYLADLDALSAKELDLYSACGIAYFQSNYEHIKQCYRKVPHGSGLKLRVASVATGAAICLDDYPFFEEVEAYLKDIIREAKDERYSAYADLCLATTYAAALAPTMVPEWIKTGDFSHLDKFAKLEASHARAKYFMCIGDYVSALAVAQTALAYRQHVFPAFILDCFARHRSTLSTI